MRYVVIPILLGLVALSIAACGSTPLYSHFTRMTRSRLSSISYSTHPASTSTAC